MREVIVEHVGSGTVRTIKVGVVHKPKPKRPETFVGIICSPRIIHHAGTDTESPRNTKCWKTTKRGCSHAKKGWQRHSAAPSRRRARWGKLRRCCAPSARILNELGRCIYPNMGLP